MTNIRKFVSDLARSFGPGIITAALVLGPGTLTVASKLGAQYQYQMLWVILLSSVFMIVFTLMASRFGFYTDHSLLTQIRTRYGKSVSVAIGVSIFLVAISFQSGNAIGSGLAFVSIFGGSSHWWIALISVAAICTLFFRSFYRILEVLMVILVIMMLTSFVLTAIVSKPDPQSVLEGIIPKIPDGSGLLIIAMVATSCSIAGAFYQSYLVQERQWKGVEFGKCRSEAVTGIALLAIISSLVIITAGSVLHSRNIEVNSVADMSATLEPLLGKSAFIFFSIGLFAASFSSLLGNATLGGSILADTLNLGGRQSQRSTRILIMVLIVAGSVIAVMFSGLRLKLIVFAQAFTILVAPLIALVLFLVTNNRKIMNIYKNTGTERIFGALGILFLLICACAYVWLMYF